MDHKIYTATAQIPVEWNSLASHDLLLHTSYLKALEEAAPKTISLYYVGVFSEGIMVGIAVIQRVKLYAKDMFRSTSDSKSSTFLKDGLSQVLKGNILVIGNLTQTGQHGMCFKTEGLSQEIFLETLFKAIEDLKMLIKNGDHKAIRAIVFKDFFKDDRIHEASKCFLQHKYYQFNVQPNMILEISSNWESIDDYVNALNKKYKTRFRRAKRKLGNIALKEMTQDELLENSEHLYQLYKNVSNKASFNTFLLPEHHFYTFKLQLQDKFRVFAYYLDTEIIGFFSLILNGKNLETYFLGYDSVHQNNNQLYLNMLYEMLAFGIDHNFESIVYARTAMEIKSSIGAKPEPMSMYIKHTNPFLNSGLQSIFKFMSPEQKWEERNPFKNPRIS